MKHNHALHHCRKHEPASVFVQILKPDIIVHSGIHELDNLLGGFKAGEITLVDGNSTLIGDLPNRLSVHTYKTFQSQTVYIDCGMHADPYKIARYTRAVELNQQKVLRHITLSRAFTVHQLSTLIHEMLEPMLQNQRPRTLIIGLFPFLYRDPDVSAQEAEVLLTQNLEKIRELTMQYNLITVCTNIGATPLSTHQGLGKTLYTGVDEIVRIKQFDEYIVFELIKKQKSTTVVRFAKGQLRLEMFGMVM